MIVGPFASFGASQLPWKLISAQTKSNTHLQYWYTCIMYNTTCGTYTISYISATLPVIVNWWVKYLLIVKWVIIYL